MFYLHIANRTENLLAQLGAVLEADSCEPFEQELFLVQSQGMERVVLQSLADQLSVFVNYRFFFPLEFLHYVADHLNLGVSPDGFDRTLLTWRLEALLRDIDAPLYLSLHSFLQGEDAARRRFQLARRLADCFDQYQLMRSEMIAGWDKGILSTAEPSEVWQMELWRRLLSQESGEIHRTMLFTELISSLQHAEEGSLAAILPRRLSVFGVHILPPLFLSYLDSLARHINVHFYLLSPCKQFWGDMQSKKAQLREQLKLGRVSGQEEKFFGHPLLASLGRQGRDLQNSMLEMDFAMEFEAYIDPAAEAESGGRTPTLLEILQRDLLTGEVAPTEISAEDNSLRIVSCHSRLRELEVLREHLLQLLDADPKLDLREIVVMAPDIQRYAPFISSIFHDIEHSIADRSLQWRNPYIAAFLLFFSLFASRFGRSEVLELLQFPEVATRFSLSDTEVEKLVHWTEAAGIRWGLSGAQRQALGVHDFSEGSFRAGLDRLLMGYTIDCEEFVCGILPFTEVEGKEAQLLGGFCHYIDLLDWAAASFQQARSLSEWEVLLQECIDRLFDDDGSRELAELRLLLSSLTESEQFTGAQPVEFSAIMEWIENMSAESTSSSGFLRGQLTFCSMLPMRSIPFQVVCLLGLDDGLFPRSDHTHTFNLLAASPQPGDRSPRSDDRYQFLEALLAARHTLYLSYVGQSEKSGESMPPSVVVSELLELLEQEYGVSDLTVTHPLYPFSSNYFHDNSAHFFSYSPSYLAVALAQQNREVFVSIDEEVVFPWWQGAISAKGDVDSVSIGELIRFFKNPPKWFVSEILGISLTPGNVQEEDSEIFEIDSLTKYVVNEKLFHHIFTEKKGEEKELLRRLQHSGQWPLGNVGELYFQGRFSEVETVVRRARELALGAQLQDRTLKIKACGETADLEITGTLSGRYEKGNLVVYVGALRGHHLLAAWLIHLLDNFQAEEFRPTWLLTTDKKGSFQQHHLEGVESDGPVLTNLLQLWQWGRQQPLPLYTEPAFVWAERILAGKIDASDKAIKMADYRIEKNYEPEWALLLAGRPVGETLESTVFVHYAEKIVAPISAMFSEKGGNE